VYRVGGGLYINLTNACTCECVFCLRSLKSDPFGNELWLSREPDAHEVMAALRGHNAGECGEIVYCGYGEPTLRLQTLLDTAAAIRREYPRVPLRLNTNGHGSLAAGEDITPRLRGLLNIVSVSLNAHDAQTYAAVCKPGGGAAAYGAMLDFARKAKGQGLDVRLSIVRGRADEDKCRAVAEAMGLPLRVRDYLPRNR
jgi:TatD family-associated radical SAM protein